MNDRLSSDTFWVSTTHGLRCGPWGTSHFWQEGNHQIVKIQAAMMAQQGRSTKGASPPDLHPRSQGDSQRHPECGVGGEYSAGNCPLFF